MRQEHRIKQFNDMHSQITDPNKREEARRLAERAARMQEKVSDTGL